MIHNREMAWLKKIMHSKEYCPIRVLYGTYVSEGVRVFDVYREFLSAPEEEVEQYREFLAKVFSKKIDDEMLELEFNEKSGIEETLDHICNDDIRYLGDLYTRIIHDCDLESYAILIFSGTVDLPGMNGRESEEVYKHIVCMICPVINTRLGLGAINNDLRDNGKMWKLMAPQKAIIWPALDNNELYTNKVMYYTDNPGAPGHELMENELECMPFRTDTEIRATFERLFVSELGKDMGEKTLTVVNKKIQESIDFYEGMVARGEAQDAMNKRLWPKDLKSYLEYAQIEPALANTIIKRYEALTNYPLKKTLILSRRLKKYKVLEEEAELIRALQNAAMEVEVNGDSVLSKELREIIARRKRR